MYEVRTTLKLSFIIGSPSADVGNFTVKNAPIKGFQRVSSWMKSSSWACSVYSGIVAIQTKPVD